MHIGNQLLIVLLNMTTVMHGSKGNFKCVTFSGKIYMGICNNFAILISFLVLISIIWTQNEVNFFSLLFNLHCYQGVTSQCPILDDIFMLHLQSKKVFSDPWSAECKGIRRQYKGKIHKTQKHPVSTYRGVNPHQRKIPSQGRELNPGHLQQQETTLFK